MYFFFSQNRELSQLSEAKRIVGQHELQNIPVLLSSKKSHQPTVRNRSNMEIFLWPQQLVMGKMLGLVSESPNKMPKQFSGSWNIPFEKQLLFKGRERWHLWCGSLNISSSVSFLCVSLRELCLWLAGPKSREGMREWIPIFRNKKYPGWVELRELYGLYYTVIILWGFKSTMNQPYRDLY